MIKKWTLSEAQHIYARPFSELLHAAQTVHRDHFQPDTVQVSTLLSIKTGRCPEDCAYCPQSIHYKTAVENEALMDLNAVIEAAKRAKETGSTRFCMGAAWRSPTNQNLERVCEMVSAVKAMGLETCVTLGMLKPEQAHRLKDAGLDFYNHNLDTSEEFYDKIITTREFNDRLDTLDHVEEAGINVCCGGILGMGETIEDRLNMLLVLANRKEVPLSVPINKLIRVPGTPLANADDIDPIDFVRTIATARILMPKTYLRLSAGREDMSDELQALCFMAGVNSIFYGETLLTEPNPKPARDDQLFEKLGLKRMELIS